MRYKNFGSYFCTRAGTMRVSRFTLGPAVSSCKIYRGTRVVGVRAGYSREHTPGMLRETKKRRLPPFAIICSDAFTCLASGAKPKREVRVENGRVCTRLGVARGRVKQNECIRKAGNFSSSTKEESTVRTIEVQTRS